MPARNEASGALGGSMNEAGGEYRRALAALFVAHALNGSPFSDLPAGHDSVIEFVRLEADSPVDDIIIGLTEGELLLQAKRTFRFGRAFDQTAEQWIRAVRHPGFNPETDLLGVGSGNISQPLKRAADAIRRRQLDPNAQWTRNEMSSVEKVQSALDKLGATPSEIDLILTSAVFIERRVEEQHQEDAQVGQLLLDGHVVDAGYGARAWRELVNAAGHAARNRMGYSIERWADELRRRGIPLAVDAAGSRAAMIEHRRQALTRYRERIHDSGSRLDLTGLGANLPPLPIEEVDANLTVQSPGSDDRFGHRLLWALHRRGRVILTGLPGGGKTTSLRSAAAQWAVREHWTTPIVVSLRRLADEDHFRQQPLRDNILDLAVENEPSQDRGVVRGALEDALGEGEAVLFLDGLDEAADRRLLLAADLHEMLSGIHADTDVLVATRDAAYSEASMLGFSDLILNQPRDMKPTMRAILEAIADQRAVPNMTSWVEERLEWIEGVLRIDSQLRETPLIPVLLSLLASERDVEDLPSTRATILAEAIQHVVERREARRDIGLQALPRGHQAAVLINSFPQVADAISTSGGATPRDQLVHALSPYLEDHWGLAPGPAMSTAEEIVRFWDEAGIFVAEGSRKMTVPRVRLFLEIGSALAAASKSGSKARQVVDEWANDTQRRESLVLAAGLNQTIAEALIDIAVTRDDDELISAAAKAIAQGGRASGDHLSRLSMALVRAMSPGDAEAWRRFKQLVQIPVATDLRTAALDALKAFPPEYAITGRAFGALEWGIDGGDRVEILEQVIQLKTLPRLPNRASVDQRTYILEYAGVDQLFMRSKVGAAEELLPHRPNLAPIVADSIRHASLSAVAQLEGVLRKNGHEQVAREATSRVWTRSLADFLDDPDSIHDEIFKTVNTIAQMADPKPLAKSQARRLHELASFVETLNLSDMSSWPTGGELDELRERWYCLIAELGGFDTGILAAQASLVSQELAWDESRSEGGHPDRDAYFSLFDGAQTRELQRWNNVDDIEAGRDLAIHLLGGGPGLAFVAAKALSSHPERGQTASAVDARLENVPRRSVRAAVWATLYLSPSDSHIRRLAKDDKPAVRAAVASLTEPLDGDHLTDVAQVLLADDEREVQTAVLDRLHEKAGHLSPETLQVLTDLSETTPDPFSCTSCGAPNPGWRDSCESCNVVNDRPDKKASKLLERLDEN